MIHAEQEDYLTPAEVASELLKTAARLTHLANELLHGQPRHQARGAQPALTSVQNSEPGEIQAPDRTVGRDGAITVDMALQRCAELGEFTVGQLAQACGLQPVQAMHWVAVLRDRKPEVLRRIEGTARYECLVKPILTPAIVDWARDHGKPFSAGELRQKHDLSLLAAEEACRALMRMSVIRATEINGFPMFEPVRQAPPSHADPPPVKRGETVMGTGKGSIERIGKRSRSTTGRRHAIEQKKKARAEMATARERRAEEQRAKAATQRATGARKKRDSRPVE